MNKNQLLASIIDCLQYAQDQNATSSGEILEAYSSQDFDQMIAFINSLQEGADS